MCVCVCALHCFIGSYCSLFAARLSRYTSAYSHRGEMLLGIEWAPLSEDEDDLNKPLSVAVGLKATHSITLLKRNLISNLSLFSESLGCDRLSYCLLMMAISMTMMNSF